MGWLRQHVGVVSQEPTLFSGTVEYNIGIGLDNVSHSDVVKAAKLANAHDFIQSLPEVGHFIIDVILTRLHVIKQDIVEQLE